MTNGPESGRFLNPGILPVLAQAAQLLDHSFVITTPGRDGSGHRFLFVNQAFTEMTGWTWEDVVGRSPKVLQGPDTDLEVIGQLRESLRNDEEFDGQTINYRKDGTPFVMKWHVRPIRDVRGKITHYFALQRDVSKETEEQNRTQRLLHALDQMPEAVVVVDPHGRVLKANHEALAWMDETDPDRVLDRPLWTLPGRPSALTDLHEIRTAVDRGEPSTHEYSTRNGPHGVTGPRVIQIAISPVADHHDHKIGFVVVASDVTEQKRLEHIAVSLNMSDHLGMVFAGLRHELGNPVNSLKSAITVLRSGTLDEQRRDHYLDQMLGQIDRMEYLLEGLRSFSLFDRITIEAVDIGALFGRIDSLSRRDLEARNIDLHVHRPDDMVALANHQALLHVLLNLISNGATAVDDKADGFVRIKARASDDRIYIQVADNGVGINANDLDRIFTPFFTNRVGGTGLGLTIVKKLISSMHGTIDAMSTPGRGTTFTIVLDNHDYE